MSVLVGRLLQVAGMIILPVALLYGLGYDAVRTEVKLLAIGGALFVIGWLMAKKPDA
jgi:high-affinity nickel permease